uniref:Nucleoporin Nup37 n=1 Tax=Ciona intestinalis TaxID=7719 RepID=F6SNN1_CIOIN|nr:nucleoporin Nup37 [Ciona intestinalis]|eukprot:XP_002123661.1 nucleoporin Nup37 [Ciona intestinalis]
MYDNVIHTDGFVSAIEFCPYESATKLLAYSSAEYLHICSVTFQHEEQSSQQEKQPVRSVVTHHEHLKKYSQDGITSISWSPSSSMKYLPRCGKLALGLLNSKVIILTTDFKEETTHTTLEGHKSGVNSVAFEPLEGNKLASVSDDNTCRIWDSVNESILHVLCLQHAGINVCWNRLEPDVLMVAELSGSIRFYSLDEENEAPLPLKWLHCGRGNLTAADWCPINPMKVGAAVGTEWVLWDSTKSSLSEDTRQCHVGGSIMFRWSRQNEDVFLTQGRPKHSLKIHHLGHRELLRHETLQVGSGATWHAIHPICAVAGSQHIQFYDVSSDL